MPHLWFTPYKADNDWLILFISRRTFWLLNLTISGEFVLNFGCKSVIFCFRLYFTSADTLGRIFPHFDHLSIFYWIFIDYRQYASIVCHVSIRKYVHTRTRGVVRQFRNAINFMNYVCYNNKISCWLGGGASNWTSFKNVDFTKSINLIQVCWNPCWLCRIDICQNRHNLYKYINNVCFEPDNQMV